MPRTWFAKIGAALKPAAKPAAVPTPVEMMSIGRDAEEPSLSLVDLVHAHETSVRLRNSLVAAADAGDLPFASVRDYVAAGTMALPIMMRDVRSFGAKTARELDLLFKAVGESEAPSIDSSAPIEAGPSPHEVLEAIGSLSLSQAIEGELLSVRLENGLANHELRSMRFSAVALGLDEFLATIQRRPNIGRTSVREMASLVRRLVPRLLAQHGVAKDQIGNTCSALFGEKASGSADELPDDVPQQETLAECLDWLLSQCEPRDRVIVERRFGLSHGEPETLEEIGSDYGVTRERIRQIEKRALKRMRIRMRHTALAEHVALASPAVWLQVSAGRGWLSDRQVDSALRKLGGSMQLALELLGTLPRTWLSTIVSRAAHGWIGTPIDPELASASAAELGAFLKLPLPRSFLDPGGNSRPAHDEAVLRIELGLELEQGYVVQSKPGLRMRRALGLHRILTSASAPLGADRFIPLYHQLCPTDRCSARDADIVMQAAPHLFIETFDQVWFGIGSCGAPPALEAQDPERRIDQPAQDESESEDENETCAGSLVAALERRGPERLLTLYQNAETILSPGRSPNSVGPTLLSNPHLFVRLLPGVYGLHHQVPPTDELLSNPPSYLLENTQLRLLALARRAGESQTVFPLWSLEGEFALARWGRHHGAPESFHSLLAVADIDAWPISASERAHWLDLARRKGRFEIADAPRQDAYVRPDLDRLLAACIEAVTAGELNWMAVNRMAGRRIDSQAGAAVMAILLAIGALEIDDSEPTAWQKPHRTTRRAIALRDDLIGEITSTGALNWGRGPGLSLQAEIRAAADELDGWPDWAHLTRMFDVAAKPPVVNFDELDPLDAIMAERHQSSEREKREELLRWLLEE